MSIFDRFRSLWNSRQTGPEESTGTKRMLVSSLLLFRQMSGKNVFDEYTAVFSDYAEVDQFLDSYLEQPHPEWVSGMLEFLGSQPVLPDESIPPLTGFLCEIIESNPERTAAWRSLTKKANKATRELFDGASRLSRSRILSIPEHSPAVNDLCWGAYRASANEKYIGKVIDQLKYCDERTDMELFAAGATAKWSLACHAEMRPSVREYVIRTKASCDVRTEELLDETLARDPSEIMNEIGEIFGRKEEDGGWDQ